MYVDVNDVDLKTGKRRPAKCTITTPKSKSDTMTALIIGGGAGGLVAAETLRTGGYAGKILIISREAYLPIDR